MNNRQPRPRALWLVPIAVAALATTAAAAYVYLHQSQPDELPMGNVKAQNYGSQIQTQFFCSRCHAYPTPDIFPKSEWKKEVEQAYAFFEEAKLPMQAPPIEGVIEHFERYAPVELLLPKITRSSQPPPVSFTRTPIVGPLAKSPPTVSHIELVHLFDERRLDVLTCDMQAGTISAWRPYTSPPSWQTIGTVAQPAHATVADLDGDGVKDVLVASLGSFEPTDRRTGSVVWLRGSRDGRFTPITLLEGVGRVADVQAADFRGNGKLDLAVAVFGWRTTGEVVYLENHTTDWNHPKFVSRVLDERHGAIHVPVGDINGDGRPDLVALISQEHEAVVAFVNEGGGRFRKQPIYDGPHPAFGSTGIQLVDLDGNGQLDVLYTNGDSMGPPHVLKPYHGIHWLENKGRFPFVDHMIAPMPGVHRALAGDFTGNGKKDIVAVSLLSANSYPQRKQLDLDALVYLEQTASGQFVRHSLETTTCDHAACALGDVFGTGKVDIVVGNFTSQFADPSIVIWKNQRAGR